jgi:serine/threonine-protein kinase ULK2
LWFSFQQTRKAVAIKTISRAILTHKLLENLESEINILKALNYKHITELKDIVVRQLRSTTRPLLD